MKTGTWRRMWQASAVMLAMACVARAQTTWDSGGAADTSWGTAVNWNNDSLPAFNGTDSLTVVVTDTTAGRGATTLGANRSISRLTIGNGGGVNVNVSVTGDTLTLTKTDSTATAGGALWNASNRDNYGTTVNSAINLLAGAAGSYTAYLYENSNANGGTVFNGPISTGPGEAWTLRFSRSSARGTFVLANAGNSIAALRNDGADVYSATPGAFGGGPITLAGSITGTQTSDHYATPVNNSITLAGAATWHSLVNTRLTGSLSQGANAFSYGSTASTTWPFLTRLEYGSFSGSGATSLKGGVVSPNAMSQFASGTLNIGDGGGPGVLVLSGVSGNGVPTWSDFIATRSFNQSGGTGTWRININAGTAANTFNSGGFAARGANLTIPHQTAGNASGLTTGTFTRNFILGSMAMLDGTRYANHAVKIETDIAYGTANGSRFFGAAHNAEVTCGVTAWVLGGPVHELAGKITGENVILYPIGTTSARAGIIRISNAENSLTGTSRWILGGQRIAFTTLGGGSIAAPGNMGDLSNIVLIFTSDAAFGGATEVQVTSQISSGTSTAALLLFEDANPSGSTTFARNLNVVSTSENQGAAGFGSYAGDAIYTGTVTLGGTATTGLTIGMDEVVVHVQNDSLTLGTLSTPAALVNNRTYNAAPVPAVINKSGPGTLRVDNLDLSGTATVAKWNVYAGTLNYNDAGTYSNFEVRPGGTLGGTGSLNLGANTLLVGGTTTSRGAINAGDRIGTLTVTAGKVQWSGYSDLVVDLGATVDKLVVNGNLDLATLNDRLVLRKAATMVSGTYEIVRYTGSLLNHGNVNENLWKFAAVENEAGVTSYSIDYGTGTDSAITLRFVGDANGTVVVVR